jgi:hypothetical protein
VFSGTYSTVRRVALGTMCSGVNARHCCSKVVAQRAIVGIARYKRAGRLIVDVWVKYANANSLAIY